MKHLALCGALAALLAALLVAQHGQQGAPTNTVLSWLRRARAQLHTMLKEEIEDEVV